VIIYFLNANEVLQLRKICIYGMIIPKRCINFRHFSNRSRLLLCPSFCFMSCIFMSYYFMPRKLVASISCPSFSAPPSGRPKATKESGSSIQVDY